MTQNFFKKILPLLIIFSLVIGDFVLAQREKETREELKEIMPVFKFIRPKEGEKIQGEITIKGRVKEAVSVEFYYQIPGVILPVYLGKAEGKGENIWEYSWNSNLTPNGSYEIFAKITNQYGEYESSKIKVKIENEVPRDEKREEEAKKEIEKAKEEIEKEEKEITEKKEETTEKIVEEIKKVSDQTKKILKEEEKKIVEPEIERKIKEAEEEIKKEVEKIVKSTKEIEKIEKEIERKEEKKKEMEGKITSMQEALKETQRVKEKLPEGPKKEEAKVVAEIKKESLKSQEKKKQEIGKELDSLRKKSEEIKKEKEKAETKIIEAVEKITKPVEEISPPAEQPKISEMKKLTQKEIGSALKDLEEKIEEKEKIKIEKSQILLKDSDGDGLSDEGEIKVGTNPFNPDSDGDGFLDRTELETGYNPLKAGPADKIIYQDPRKVLPKKAEIYRVEKVEKVILATGEMGLKFTGKALPNSFVTIYIFSHPIVVVVKTNQNGYWEYILDKPLADGEHRVYATLTNNRGEIEARSDVFVFVKAGEKIFRIFETPAAEAISPVEALQKPFIILILAIIILALGIALIIISLLTKKKIEKIKGV